MPNLIRLLPVLALSALALASPRLRAADIYDAAVAHPGRPAADLMRDAIDHPAEVMRLAGFRPGMTVVDYFGAGGYYSELLAYVVGPSGHVLLVNNPGYEAFSEGHWKERIQRAPNIEHLIIEPEHLSLKDKSVDAVVLSKAYHDLYWVDEDPKDNWPKFDVGKVLGELARIVKPGGTVLVVDHSAKPGTGSSAASSLHRIDEQYAQADFEKAGFTLVSKSDLLRRPDDARDQITYKGPLVGKTDRFVLVFRRKGG
ncbi:MAG: class I SAM-dependent methyltransferase [Proteobacteria bacterium]|nr:class I SAM-dependent methyltransferase [Pseudomonadota bacterium]